MGGSGFRSPEKCICVHTPIPRAQTHNQPFHQAQNDRLRPASHPVPSPSRFSLCLHAPPPPCQRPLSFQDALEPGAIPLQGAHTGRCPGLLQVVRMVSPSAALLAPGAQPGALCQVQEQGMGTVSKEKERVSRQQELSQEREA